MTRIAIFSDMQLDHPLSRQPDLAGAAIGHVDLCVVAGDHRPPLTASVRALAPLAARVPVVYVPGNRDYHRTVVEDETEAARAIADEVGVTLLQDDVAEVAGVRVIGATLYTDYALNGDVAAGMRAARRAITDHVMVATRSGSFPPEVAAAVHASSLAFVEGCLAAHYGGATVVVTHHAPHVSCNAPRHRGDALSPAFASDLTRLLAGPRAPDLWVHGGTHHPHDTRIGRTRVVSHPSGYPGECAGFALDKVVELAVPGTRPGEGS